MARNNKEFKEISPDISATLIKKHTGEIAVKDAAMGRVDKGPSNLDDEPMAMQLRPVFHRMLYHQVAKLGIEITYKKRAIEYTEDDEEAYVLTDDQQRASADVIIAADGIGSKAQQIINEGKAEARSSGTGMYRASCPTALALSDPVAVKAFGLKPEQKAVAQVWMG